MVKHCENCKHWRLDRGTNKRICMGYLSDEYGDYTAGFHGCLAWEQAASGRKTENDTGN